MRSPRRLTYAAALLALLVLPREASRAQDNAVRIEFAGDTARSTVIGAFRRAGMVYVSLNDLAQIFSLSTYESRESQKFEIKRLTMRLKVAGGNPFVVVTDAPGHQTIYQLPANVVYAANSFFIPLAPFLPLLRPVFGVNASYNRWTGVLGIGTQAAAPAFDISTVRLEVKSNGMLIRIAATKKLSDYENWMRADGWLYVTVGDARADIAAINSVRPAGLVKQIIAIQSPTSVQLTFRLSGKIAASEIMSDNESNDLILVIRTPGTEETGAAATGLEPRSLPKKEREPLPLPPAAHRQDTVHAGNPVNVPSPDRETETPQWPTVLPPLKKEVETGTPTGMAAEKHEAGERGSAAAAPPPPRRERENPQRLDTERDKWKLDVIVLDAGHGGYDPGTIGVTGVKEKTIALGIVLKLGALITANLKGVDVVYTRKDDRFIELDRRGKIANEAGG